MQKKMRGVEISFKTDMGQSLKCHDHEGRLANRMLKNVFGSTVESTKRKGKPEKRWRHTLFRLFRGKGISDEDEKGLRF